MANRGGESPDGSMVLVNMGDQKMYDHAVPLMVNANRVGTLRLGLVLTRAQKAMHKILVSAVATMVLTLIIAGVAGSLMFKPVTRSIKKLYESSEQALRGNLDVITAPELDKNCWDIMGCGNQDCPAYKNVHHRCWYTAGTLCPTCVEGEYARNIDSCRQCRVYKHCSGDEIQSLAESFDAMTLSLKCNLSDLKDAERILNEQKALLQTILDAIPDFISLQDHQGRYISVNRAFCEMLDRKKENIVGRVNDDLFPRFFADRYNTEDKKVLETGISLIKENKIAGKTGPRWLHVVKVPVSKSRGRVNGLVCSGRDITQLKAVQQQLTHAQKMESVGRLAAGVAHEINTPLGIILGYAQLLLEDVDEDKLAYQDVTTIVKQTRICTKIVADLLKFSRPGESIVSQFDINQAMEEVLEVVEHTFGLNHIRVERDYEKTPLPIKGDKEKIKQVFVNLLNNAVDAIGENGCIFVCTGPGETPADIRISISDTGCGIAREDIAKIFEPFYTTKGPDQGTGLGLSVTFGIIREHNGTIKAFSPPISDKIKAKGTQFVVMLPSGLNAKERES